MAVTWIQVRDVLDEVLQIPPADRSRYLDRACPQPELRRHVDSLIVSYEKADEFLERPAVDQGVELWSAAESSEVWMGRRVGPYKIEAKIAEGGMGTVFRALRADDEYRKQVAIKLIKGGFASSFALARFKTERQILAGLEHPNIAQLLDGGRTENGHPYLVMEFVEGVPIDEYCDAHKLAIDERLKLFRTVCSAVQFAHQNLVIHRDLKPANILVTADGVPKLLDFGIAKLLSSDSLAPAPDQTATFLRMLTPEYASPEQVRGDPVNTATDVYSLGVVLYILLSGHRPYQLKGTSSQALTDIICNTEPVKPSVIVARTEVIGALGEGGTQTVTPESVSSARQSKPDKLRRRLSGDLDNIVLMALRKDPQRRYASVEQFSDDVRRHLDGLPVRAREDTFAYRVSKFVKRHKLAVAASALFLITLLGGIAATLREAHIARAERAKAERRFNDVRSLANSLLFDVHDSIKDLPGATPARKLLVDRALRYLDGLSQEAGGDPSLQRELAAAYEKVGDVQGNPYYANLGDTSKALQSYRKALGILDSLPIADRNSIAVKRMLSDLYYRIGSLQDAGGDYQGSLTSSRNALAVDQALGATNDPKDRDNLAGDFNDIGLKLQRTGDINGSLTNYHRAAEVRQAIQTEDPKLAPQVKLHLASDFAGEAESLSFLGKSGEAVAAEQRSIAILREASSRAPDNDALKFALGQAYQELGPILDKNGEPERALEAYQRAAAIFASVSAADPSNELAKRFLGFSYEDMGKSQVKKGDVAAGLQNLNKALAIFKSMPGAAAKNDFVLSGLAETYFGLGMAQAALASHGSSLHWREARSWYQQSLDIWTEMSSRGALAWVDKDKPRLASIEIARCDAHITKQY